MKCAIVLCSGGLDSVTTAFYVKKKLNYERIKLLFFDYGQKSLERERECAKKCAKGLEAEFQEIGLDWLGKISNSLINKRGKIKKLERNDLRDTKKESEKYYVPCRNTVFLTYALTLAEAEFIKDKIKFDIFVGFKNEGKEPFPDATKEFVSEMNKLSKISTKGFKIIAPLIEKDKEDIILLGKNLGVKFSETHSCYTQNKACGKCLACMLKKEGFYWANMKDSTIYASQYIH